MSSGRYGRGWYSPPYFDGHRFGAIDGIRVLERPDMLTSTRSTFLLWHSPNADPTIVCWSMEVFRIMIARLLGADFDFAAWHDRPFNCPTWTDAAGCRCEVDP